MTQVDERRALVDKLAATLQARVLSGEIPTGARLRQEALAEEFGVSRTPVREALRKLQAGGIVDVQPHRGALVRTPSAREVRDAYEVRAELEGLAAQLASARFRDGHLERLQEAIGRFETVLERRRTRSARELRARDIAGWDRANDEFHQTVQEASANDQLISALAHLHRSVPRDLSRLVLGESVSLLEQNVDQHRAILAAIESRDGAKARQLMVEHVRRAGELVTLRLEEQAGG